MHSSVMTNIVMPIGII